MPIAINGSGTVTGISVGGLPDGIVDTDMLAAKAATTSKIGNGGIIQVIQVQKTDTASQSLTGTANFNDISGLSVTITPTSSSNKILVVSTVSVSCDNGNRNTHIRHMRGSTPIGVGTSGSQTNSSFYLKTRDSFSPHNVSTQVLDSPSTTSATTYKIQWSGESGDTFFLNRNASSAHGGNEGMVSTLTVMEVVA
jgi:hypothetical protein